MKIIQSYKNIFFTTVIQGLLTIVLFNGSTYIDLVYLDFRVIYAISCWLSLSAIYYYTIQVFVFEKANKRRQVMLAIAFGVMGVSIKALLDLVLQKISLEFFSAMSSVIINEIGTCVFGVIWMYLLFFVVGKQRFHKNKKRIKSPIIVMVIIAMIYTAYWIHGFLYMQMKIDRYPNITYEQLINMDYYFALKYAWFNAPVYVAFYVVFWWFLRCCTMEEIQVDRETAKDISESEEDWEYFDYEEQIDE